MRIGAFGDSYTYGSESGAGQSIPAQLGRLFRSRLPDLEMEVLNFGRPGHGCQQHWLFIKEFAAPYQLDYILLGPEGCQPHRETVMVPDWSNQNNRHHPRGRFILKNKDVQFVNIQGKSFSERRKNYYTLMPPLIVLKYDRGFFDSIKRLYFPQISKKIKNPFYYSDLNTDEESRRINTVLLKKIASLRPRRFLFLQAVEKIYNLYKDSEKQYNLNFINPFPRHDFLYDRGHYSSLGNELWAEIYFHGLTGQKDFSLKTCLNAGGKRRKPMLLLGKSLLRRRGAASLCGSLRKPLLFCRRWSWRPGGGISAL